MMSAASQVVMSRLVAYVQHDACRVWCCFCWRPFRYTCPEARPDERRGFFMQNVFSSFNSTTTEQPLPRKAAARQPHMASRSRVLVRRVAAVAAPLLVLGLWQMVVTLELLQSFLVPAPLDVLATLQAVLADGTLWYHTRVTLAAVAGGLAAGLTLGVILGYLIAHSPLLEDLFSPVIVAFQSTPVVAYAPLLVYLVGTGVEGKIVTGLLIVLFPMLMNTIVGIRSVPADLHDLMRVSGASRWQVFVKLELPAAMPVLLTGLKTAATLSVIGAVVGEFIVADAGLGYLITLARSQYNTALVYVAMLTLATLGIGLYQSVALLERRLLRWQRRNTRRGSGAL